MVAIHVDGVLTLQTTQLIGAQIPQNTGLCRDPDVIFCSVLAKKYPECFSTQRRYILHVINSNQGHAIYSMTFY